MAENNGPKFNFIFLPPTPWLLMSKVYSSVCLSQSTIEPQNRCVRYFWDIFQPLGCAHWVFGIKYWCQLIKTRFCDAKNSMVVLKDGLQNHSIGSHTCVNKFSRFFGYVEETGAAELGGQGWHLPTQFLAPSAAPGKYCQGDQPPIRALELLKQL